MEQDFERIHRSKSRISQILFLFGGIPVYIRTGLRSVHMVKRNTKYEIRNTKYKSTKSPYLYFVFRPVTFVVIRRNTKLIVFVIRMVVVPYAISKY